MSQINVGNFFIIGISGLELKSEEKNFIEAHDIGGIILFKKNYTSFEQVHALIASIKKLKTSTPLFISIDQEGGRVKRLGQPFIQLPPMKFFGEKNSPKFTFEAHQVMAKELFGVGVNLNFSPVADITYPESTDAIGDRSFGSDVELVSKHVTAVVRSFQTEKVIACAKHFPGHGRAIVDSHEELPCLDVSLEVLKETDLIPFVKSVKSRVETIMMSHLLVPAIDPNLPCSLSPIAYDFCRSYLNFKKVIITDDLEMKAFLKYCTFEEAGFRALIAGADLVIYRNFEVGAKALELALKANFDSKKLIEKVDRVKKLKEKYLTNSHQSLDFCKNIFNSIERRDLDKKLV